MVKNVHAKNVLLQNEDLSCLKSILFYQEYQGTMFAGWICPKTTNDKNGHIWPKDHGLTP